MTLIVVLVYNIYTERKKIQFPRWYIIIKIKNNYVKLTGYYTAVVVVSQDFLNLYCQNLLTSKEREI